MIDIIEKIRLAWDADTAAGASGTYKDPKGQCAVTALLVQDLFGGDLLRAVVEVDTGDDEYVDGGWCPKTRDESHYWNLLPGGGELDLTRNQYAADQEIPRGEIVPRSRLLDGERAIAARTPERYALLRRRYLLA
jgi:hypothetical protein